MISAYILVVLQGGQSKQGQPPKKAMEDDGQSVRFAGESNQHILGDKR